MSFNNMGLSRSLLHAINKKGYTEPSPIQEKVIPVILEGRDVLASAQTGTGKTAGFTLPILQLLLKGKQARRRPVRALVLTPTRELAAQVYDNVKSYSEFLSLESTVIFGGVNQNPQIRALRNGVDFLVATPGRLLDLHTQKKLYLDKVEYLVLDEADRMLDMGFLRDIKRILTLLPENRQNLLFSATFSKEIRQLAESFLDAPVQVSANPENTTVEKITQKLYKVDKRAKTDLMIKLITEGNWRQVLIFMRTKHGANRLCQRLVKKGITAAAIHSNKGQGSRTKALAGFKSGTIRVLVATDIAARGLDIPLLPHVVNFELPNVPADYVHRIGRTGRAGASGEAISLVSAEEAELVKGIEKLLQETLTTEVIDGFEPGENFELKETQSRNQKTRSKGAKTKPRTHGGSNRSRSRSKAKRNWRSKKPGNNRSSE